MVIPINLHNELFPVSFLFEEILYQYDVSTVLSNTSSALYFYLYKVQVIDLYSNLYLDALPATSLSHKDKLYHESLLLVTSDMQGPSIVSYIKEHHRPNQAKYQPSFEYIRNLYLILQYEYHRQ